MPNDKGFFTFFILGARKRAAPIVCYNENSPFFSLRLQIMLLQPSRNEVGNLSIVLLLEHEMTVAVDVLVGQIDDRGIAAVGIVLLGEVSALLEHHLPETRRLDVLGAILDIVTKEEQHRNLCSHELLVGVAAYLGSKAWLYGDDSCRVVRVRRPAHATALRVGHVDALLARHRLHVF